MVHSVGLEYCEVLGVPQPVQQPLPVLQMHRVVFHSRVEGAFQAVLAQVLAGQDAEGLMVGRALGGPQRPHLRNGVDPALELLVGLHEVLLADVQACEHFEPLVPVLADIAEDGLGEVLHHILGLSLFPLLPAPLGFEVAVFGPLFGRTVDLSLKLDVLEWFLVGYGAGWLLDDAHVILGGFGLRVLGGAGAKLFQIIELSIA